ncbi:MAG TPA: PIN domain-containing protein [Verrucomicrobiae bacterium]|nr:PIN domain-containing protein [Verrucomicrobiae bacterium]
MIAPLFLDSSFWVVYRDEEELRHQEANRIMNRCLRERLQFVTTWPVFCEIHANFSRNTKQRELILKDFWQNPLILLEQTSPQDHGNALEILRSHRDKTYSLCDALSFAVMRRLGIRRVASFDRHFKQFGEFDIVS